MTRKNIYLILTLSSIMFMTGCAKTLHKGPSFREATPPRNDNALVYIYRPHAPPLWRNPTIYINGIEILDLYNLGYSYIYAKPGTYKLKTDWSFDAGPPDLEGEMTVKGGKTYYIRMTGSMAISMPNITTSSKLQTISTEQVLSDIKRCMYIKPKIEYLN